MAATLIIKFQYHGKMLSFQHVPEQICILVNFRFISSRIINILCCNPMVNNFHTILYMSAKILAKALKFFSSNSVSTVLPWLSRCEEIKHQSVLEEWEFFHFSSIIGAHSRYLRLWKFYIPYLYFFPILGFHQVHYCA